MLKFDDVTSGNFQALPTVTVRDSVTSQIVNIFSSNTSTPLTNPFTGSENGAFEFWVESGTYNIFVNEGTADETSLLNETISEIGGGVGGAIVSEVKIITDGQTTVTFSIVDVTFASIYVSNGR